MEKSKSINYLISTSCIEISGCTMKFKTSCIISFLLFPASCWPSKQHIIEMTHENQCEIECVTARSFFLLRLLRTFSEYYCIKEEENSKNWDWKLVLSAHLERTIILLGMCNKRINVNYSFNNNIYYAEEIIHYQHYNMRSRLRSTMANTELSLAPL